MSRLFFSSAAVALALVAAPSAMIPTTGASNAQTAIYIERQCVRYGNYCDGTRHTAPKTVYKKTYKSKHKAKKTYPAYRHNRSTPFIERQCWRYGNFCTAG